MAEGGVPSGLVTYTYEACDRAVARTRRSGGIRPFKSPMSGAEATYIPCILKISKRCDNLQDLPLWVHSGHC